MAYAVKQYRLATELLEEEFNSNISENDKARKSQYLAYSYDILGEYGEALQWYDVADQYFNNEKSKRELAESLKKNERYSDAAELFSELYNQTRDIRYRQEAGLCVEASNSEEKLEAFRINAFPVNSKYSDYSPGLYESDFIVFSSDREGSTGNRLYKWNDRSFSDLYVTDLNGRNFNAFDAIINSEHNEGTFCFSKDYEEIFFTRCVSTENRDQHCKIFYSQKPNDFWLEPEALMFFDDLTNFGHPCLVENDSVLIFTAKPPGSSNYDLFYSVRIGKAWSEADIMPDYINTEGDEKFPTSKGDTLFFASDGHLGFGGLDLFMSVLQEDGSWSRPQNLGIPINSGADDFSLILDPKSENNANIVMQGYFTSSRNTGFSDDIFGFTQYVLPDDEEEVPEEELAEETEPEKKQILVYLAGIVEENVREGGDPNKSIIETNSLGDIRIEISSPDSLIRLNSNERGQFITQLTSGGIYSVQVRSPEHINRRIKLEIPGFEGIESDTTINVKIALDRLVYDTEIILSDIFYDFDRWEIREDAEAPLDSLAEILSLNPQFDIELGSHTDCRGEEDYNQDLSQKRAQSAVEYLSEAGIDNARLKAIGYGESIPAVECICASCTEEEHQANRRTTFKILKPDDQK